MFQVSYWPTFSNQQRSERRTGTCFCFFQAAYHLFKRRFSQCHTAKMTHHKKKEPTTEVMVTPAHGMTEKVLSETLSSTFIWWHFIPFGRMREDKKMKTTSPSASLNQSFLVLQPKPWPCSFLPPVLINPVPHRSERGDEAEEGRPVSTFSHLPPPPPPPLLSFPRWSTVVRLSVSCQDKDFTHWCTLKLTVSPTPGTL